MTDVEIAVATDALFARKDANVLATYRRILDALRPLGPFREEPKKTPHPHRAPDRHPACRQGQAGLEESLPQRPQTRRAR